MKFVSLFNPVSLAEDPDTSEDGSLYFNTSSSVYRAKLNGNWVSLVDENNVHILTSNSVIYIGDESTVSNSVTLIETHENNTLYIQSSSVSTILIDNDVDYPVRDGAEVKIIYAGTGKINIQTASTININTPSEVYLTSQWDSATLLKLNDTEWIVKSEFRDLY